MLQEFIGVFDLSVSHLQDAVSASKKFIEEFNGGLDASRIFM